MILLLLACGGRPGCPDDEVWDGRACGPEVVPEAPPFDGWSPAPGVSWQWQLSGAIDTTVDAAMFDVDLFDAPDAALDALRAQGRVVICYFSAGSHEDWRPDAADFPPEAIGAALEGWPGERWLDVAHPGIRAPLAARLDLAVARGCDGVEPDNVDGYVNRSGFPLTAAEQRTFNRWLADEAHRRGLSVGLKNDVDQVPALVARFDWALNEECVAYGECDAYGPFLDAGKAVLHVEYVDDWADAEDLAAEVCPAAPRLDTLIKAWDLGPERLSCGG